ncbi:MAG: hypothetical protein M1479_08470 [Actinobacteria bacterium]|nr:hypothetical protein [Cyanobacteriota bacterium]MCL5772292.1 hypothetical protein [Actinomycetota bacterium]
MYRYGKGLKYCNLEEQKTIGLPTETTVKNIKESQTNNTSTQNYAIIASGVSYDKQHYRWFLNSTCMAYNLLKNNGYSDKNIYYLFGSYKEPDVDYEATIDNFKKVINELQRKTEETDNILLFLIGHGAHTSANSYYSLNNYKISDIEMALMFKNIKRNKKRTKPQITYLQEYIIIIQFLYERNF